MTADSRTGTPAYIGRRIQHHKFTASTVVRFRPEAHGERAGLMLLKNDGAQYFLALADGDVELIRVTRKGREILASQKVDRKADKVYMQVVSDGVNFTFNCRTNPDDDWLLVADNVDASHISCERTGGFTGATIGLYAETTDNKWTAKR